MDNTEHIFTHTHSRNILMSMPVEMHGTKEF